jgi:hypothetical protein
MLLASFLTARRSSRINRLLSVAETLYYHGIAVKPIVAVSGRRVD